MSDSTGIEKFDNYLEDEFTKLGFNYHEMKAGIIKNTVQGRYEMSIIAALDEPYFYADCFEARFIISNAINQPKPVLESMDVALCCQTGYDEYITLIEKTYLANEGRLPTKNQIIADTKELLRIKISQPKFNLSPDQITMSKLSETNKYDKRLDDGFSSLRFNYQDIKANGTSDLGQGKSQMFLVDYLDSPFMLADGLAVIFTITNGINDQQPVIQEMSATLFNDSCYGQFTSLVEKKYSLNECSLPTKGEVMRELTEMLKIKKVKEKFGMEADSPQLRLNHKKTANKKRL